MRWPVRPHIGMSPRFDSLWQGCVRTDDTRRWMGGQPPPPPTLDPLPPDRGLIVGKKGTKRNVDLGHFWYTYFSVPDPLPPPPLSSNRGLPCGPTYRHAHQHPRLPPPGTRTAPPLSGNEWHSPTQRRSRRPALCGACPSRAPKPCSSPGLWCLTSAWPFRRGAGGFSGPVGQECWFRKSAPGG